jgi:MYXO-CTERM domain-containing protein
MKAHARLALLALAALAACTGQDEIGTGSAALTVKSQLRGYDLGPPFPAGFRDSGLVNGYAENEWVPFVAVMEGSKLEDADALAGGVGDGRYGASIIVPSYSAKHDANAIVDLQVTGTYGEGAITPIPDPFDAHWLASNGYQPFVLGAFADTGDSDLAPSLARIAQKTGPTRFGGEVGSASIPVEFAAPAGATKVELRFAVRLARRGLEKVAPGGQAFPGTADGSALGAADFFPGPGPIFVGYDVGKPTGIATVPIRVVRHSCASDDECPPGRYCDQNAGSCAEPCVDDSNCAADEICEDGACQQANPPCTSDGECDLGDVCVGGYCLPPCPPAGNDGCAPGEDGAGDVCDAEACCGGYHDNSPPCVADAQCEGGYICDDGVCVPPESPCDVSCPGGEECVDGNCEPGGNPCSEDSECAGGEVCVDGHCHEGQPACEGEDCDNCTWDQDCPGGEICVSGECHPAEPPVTCSNNGDCPANQVCEGGFCDGKETCSDDSDCPNGEACDDGLGLCVPEHPPIPCSGSGDCPSGDTCTSGTCQPPGGGCTDNSDCTGDSQCVDNGGVELCVPPHPPIPCSGDGDCPSGDVCLSGYCGSNDDSGGGGPGGSGPGGGTEPCNNDLDCPSNTCVDDGGVELCVPQHPPVPCDTTSDCPAGDLCAGGFCTSDTCEDADDCPAGTVCDNTVDLCVPEHPPVPCSGDSDCPGDDRCEAGFCAPQTDCQDDTDCAGGEVCVDNGGVELCEPGQPPIPCTTPAECPAPDNCGLDDVGDCDAVCEGGYCLPGGDGGGHSCSADADCPGGYGCQGGHCVPVQDPVACDSQYDCGGHLCTGGFCEPGGGVVTCETAQDCYGNDDVGNETCVDGVCHDNSVDLRLCSSDDICPAGYECRGGTCNRTEGACELDADCSGGQSCIDGWCGERCADGCSGVCALGRCVAACGTYSDCQIGEACLSGGCVPRYAAVARSGGDPQLWVVALPGSGNIEGGCQAGGNSGATGGLLLVLAALLGLRRRRQG